MVTPTLHAVSTSALAARPDVCCAADCERVWTLAERPIESTRRNADLGAWERWIAHAGYVSEGLLYLLIGVFALLATLDYGRRPNGTRGVLVNLSLTPPGDLLLGIVALGLASFVAWQLLIAIRDPEHRGEQRRTARRIVRFGHLLSGILHSVLVIEAMRILFGFDRNANGDQSQKALISRAFDVPGGRLLVGIVGVGSCLFGLYQAFRAVTRRKDSRVDLARSRIRPLLDLLGLYGLLCRGGMFLLVGVYLTRAAWHRHAAEAVGVAGALTALRQQPYGAWLLGIVATGLVAYGLWQIGKEPYRALGRS